MAKQQRPRRGSGGNTPFGKRQSADDDFRKKKKEGGTDRPNKGGKFRSTRPTRPTGDGDRREGGERRSSTGSGRSSGTGRSSGGSGYGERRSGTGRSSGGSGYGERRSGTGRSSGGSGYGERRGGTGRSSGGSGYGERKSYGSSRSSSSGPRRDKPFGEGSGDFRSRREGGETPNKSGYERRERPSYGDKPSGERRERPTGERRETGGYKSRRADGDAPNKSGYERKEGGYQGRKYTGSGDSGRGGKDFDTSKPRGEGDDKPKRSYKPRERKSFVESKVAESKARTENATEKPEEKDGLIRLNKFISNSGVCSRREADELIKLGVISVNGTTITEMGFKVKATDDVRHEGKKLTAERPVYILLNKPKGFITTTEDPQERNTVMHLIAGACKERVYPVGRLDRNTTGLLLLTNDGDLTDKLTHPSFNAKKIYKVELDKKLNSDDFEKIKEGVHLEEGKAMVDDIAIVSDDGMTVGIELHIGWNHVVRRIFDALGYVVVKLDRVVYAGLDKKDLKRGQWRFLKNDEIVRLKHFESSK